MPTTMPRLIFSHSRHFALQGRELLIVPPYQISLIQVNKKNLEELIQIFSWKIPAQKAHEESYRQVGGSPSVTLLQQRCCEPLASGCFRQPSPGHLSKRNVFLTNDKHAFCPWKREIQTKSNNLAQPIWSPSVFCLAFLLYLAGGHSHQRDRWTRQAVLPMCPGIVPLV